MNKRPNPFMPNPYPPQPPLPAGPPPPQQPQQYDYSAYWAAAAAAQQSQTGAPAQATPQWAPPTVGAQPPQPPPRTSEQNALYANYGYGGAAGQQQAMLAAQQQQQQRPAAPYWTPPAPGYPPVASGAPYPYPQQPPAAYQPQPPPPAAMPYTPQAQPMPVYQPPHPPQQVAPPPPPPQRRFQPPQPSPQQQQPHHLPAPPAKRPRFDSGPPNPNNGNNAGWRPNNANNNSNTNGIPTAPAQHGNFPVQQPGFDRFAHGNRGRGGGVMLSSSNNNNRGRGFNNHGHNRGGYGRHGHGGNNPPRGPSGFRGNAGAPLGPRHGLPANPTKRERESKRERGDRERESSLAESEGVERGHGHGGKRTLTDFRIVGVECGVIGWEWGVLDRVKEEKEKDDDKEEKESTDAPKIKEEPSSPVKPPPSTKTPQPAPSRLRIYFHSASDPEADALPRKRKKDADEEDEDGGARKKVQGREVDKDKSDDKAGDAPETREDEAPLEKAGDGDETLELSYPPSPDEQDAVSQKPPPTPGESTPTPFDSSAEISAPAVEGQEAPVENGHEAPDDGHEAPVEHGQDLPVENGQEVPADNDNGPNAPDHSTLANQAPEGEPSTTASLEADGNASIVDGQEPNTSIVEGQDPDASIMTETPTVAEEPTDRAPTTEPEADTAPEADMSASTIAPEDESFAEPIVFPTLDPPPSRAPDRSANRISISYANSTRRLVIDADVVKRVRIVRAKAQVEITLEVVVVRGEEVKEVKEEVKEEGGEKLVLGENDRFRGVLVEAYNDSTQRYELITPHAATLGNDLTIPDLSKVGHSPAEITIVVHLDRDKPLTETKWVKTGDLDEWLSNEFGPLRPDPSGRANWSGKIEVADPDPAPTITTLMEAWCGHTMVGQPKERRRFVRTHMSNIDHILEILLRLVRGERATAGGGQQQTHVSLAVLAIFRVAADYGARAGIERQVVEERVSEIVRSLPTHLVYKSLDGMFREWSFSQKKGDKARDKS